MDFIKKRVKQYQEKKLDEALSKIKFHSNMKKQLEKKVKDNDGTKKTDINKEIVFHGEMLEIWQKNTEKIKNELKKIDT